MRANVGLVRLVLFVVLDSSVTDCGRGRQVGGLGAPVLFEDSLLLSISEHEQLLFLGGGEVLVG